MTRILLTLITIMLAITGTISAQLPQGSTTLKSPDGKSLLKISAPNDSTMIFAVSRSQKTYIDTAQVFLYFKGSHSNAIRPSKITKIQQRQHRDTLRSKLWERAIQPDHYNETSFLISDNKASLTLKIRMYNQGFATGIDISCPSKDMVDNYYTTYHWTNKSIFHILDLKSENGYNSVTGKDKASAISPLLTVSNIDTLLALTSEAANYEFFSRAKINADNFNVTISQHGQYQISGYSTPWHYVTFADNATDFMEGKYIVRSLNLAQKGNYNWVTPGKVYRHLGNKDSDFATNNIKRSIDFAAQMKFQYVLIDNGWYGLGYANEFDPNSNPKQTVAPLDLPEALKYAKLRGVGIILYFNRTAFYNYDADSILTQYSKMGVKGIKLGFFKNRDQMDNVIASRIITKCASLNLVVNVHDEYRPTGVERLYPNLLTCEGLRGNEHLDNTAQHTSTLPFIRFMTGAGDYTICYDAADTPHLNMKTTKAHQLALSVILFSPLQHILWYGSPEWYTNETEIELFKQLPVVWDDYKVIGGFPRRYLTIARRKGDTWYLASITGLLKTDISFPLSKITNKRSSITLYEDGDTLGTIKKSSFYATPDTILDISLRPNSGSVMVIKPEGR